MEYKIEGTPLPVVNCLLEKGEMMICQAGGMSWMTSGIVMETKMSGGFMKGLGRMFTGESLFLNCYHAKEKGEISYASKFPGEILAFNLAESGPLIAQKHAFLASTTDVDMEIHFKKNILKGFFGGEGFIMQRISGTGTVFLEIDGCVVKKTLQKNEKLIIDTGHIAAYTEGMKFDITSIKGFKNILFGGEGLFNTTLEGPGIVYLQTMPLSNISKYMASFHIKNQTD